MERRTFLLGAAGALAGACLPPGARANVPKPYSFDATPPLNSRDGYISWMVANRGEDPKFLEQHWARYEVLVQNRDVMDDRNKRAFLLVPREEFVLKQNSAASTITPSWTSDTASPSPGRTWSAA